MLEKRCMQDPLRLAGGMACVSPANVQLSDSDGDGRDARTAASGNGVHACARRNRTASTPIGAARLHVGVWTKDEKAGGSNVRALDGGR
eukprot:360774-Chlamydomonas_euryale.AAC.20